MNHEIYLSTGRFCSALAAGVPVNRNDLQDYFDTVSVLSEEILRQHGNIVQVRQILKTLCSEPLSRPAPSILPLLR